METMFQLRQRLWYSQLALFAALLVCTVLKPSVMIENGGVSNFGNYLLTVVPYAAGFGLNIFFTLRASENLPVQKWQWTLRVLALLTFLVFISTFPRRFSFTFSDIHDDLGIALYGYEFLLSLWVVRKRLNTEAIGYIALETAGSLVGLFSIIKVIHFLFIGQIVGALGFALVECVLMPKTYQAIGND